MTDRSQLSPRHRELISLVELHGHASINFLAQRLNCSAQTVRRDIRMLCEAHVLQRFRGGARVDIANVRLGYATKQDAQQAEKARMAAWVVGQLPSGSSLFLDTGTTCDHVARELLESPHTLHVVTHNLNAAMILSARHHQIDIQVTGGRIAGSDGAVTGGRTVAEMGRYQLDYAVVSVSGVDDDGYLLDFDSEKIDVKQAMLRHARHAILVMGSSKLCRRGIQRVAHLDAFAQVVCDAPVPVHLQSVMARPECWLAVP